MPGVWNVNNGYNVNTKKVSSKLTFEVGERFTGRIVSKGDGKDVTIKTADGWQFIAELDGKVNLDDIKLVKFQVDGFENGKLKLKLVKDTTNSDTVEDDNFKDIIEKEGLSKDDIEVLKKMVSHNIPLTKENINEIKGLIQFNEKINSNPEEIDGFIEKYLESKGIDSSTQEGQQTKELLTKFFNVFKNMTSDEIITFIENKLDFSEENIESFNKLFNGDSSIEKILAKIGESINNIDTKDNKYIKNSDESLKNQIMPKEVENKLTDNSNNTLAYKVYNSNDPISKKINVLDILKTISINNENESTDNINKININNSEEVESNTEKLNSIVEKLQDKDLLNYVKSSVGDIKEPINGIKNQASNLIDSVNKSKLEDVLSNIEGKEVKLNDNEYKKIIQMLNKGITSNDYSEDINKSISNNNSKHESLLNDNIEKSVSEDFIQSSLSNKDLIKTEMKEKINSIRDMVKDILTQTEVKDVGYDKVMSLIKDNINSFKVFNSVSNEYYYLNFPININSNEYPCQLIIKDNRKDGKKIDTTNVKMVISVKTINLGDIDGYLTLKDKRIDVTLKCNKEFTSILNNNKVKLNNGLGTLGLFVNVNVAEREEPADIVSCRNFFNDLTISAIDIKV